MGFVTVVEVCSVVGNFIGQIDELCLKRRTLVEQVFRELGKLVGGIVAGVLDDAFAHFKSEVEAAEGRIAQLEVLDDAQRMQIVIEEQSVLAHGRVEDLFAGVSKRRVADVVDQGQSFHQVDVETELALRWCGRSGRLRGYG